MKITGRYTVDENFITVFTEDTMYTLCRRSTDWGKRKVGEWLACGGELTCELFDSLAARCSKVGTFTLEEE